MIYVDTSVALAELLAEDRRPGESFWNQTLVSSRLLEYEVWTRVHARKLARSHGEAARALDALAGAYRSFATGIFCLWYPVKAQADADALARSVDALALPKTLRRACRAAGGSR